MKIPDRPADELARLEAIRELGILDTPADENVDRFTRLAKSLFDVPVSLVTIIDDARQWFKSADGIDFCETSRDVSFCGHTILTPNAFCVPDALDDDRFADNPLVSGPPHIRFYAGVPLTLRSGYRIGTLCIIDQKPRACSDQDIRHLEVLGACLVDVLEHFRSRETYSEERFRDYAEVASDWFWEMDEQLRFTYLSERFFLISGLPAGSLIGKTRSQSGLDLSDPAIAQNIKDLNERRAFKDFEHFRVRPDGHVVHMSTSGKPFFDEDGRFKGYRGTGTDITRRKNAEMSMLRALQRAEQANAVKSRFLASMSHELRTPLNAIIGFSEALSGQYFGAISDKNLEFIRDIHTSGRHLLELVNDLLDVSTIDAGLKKIEKSAFPVAAAIHECIDLVRPAAGNNDLKYRLIGIDADARFYADRRAVKQIVTNLLTNAIKFSKRGGPIDFAASIDEHALTITVADQGIGIPPERLATIFEPFESYQRDPHVSVDGWGLGLPICKALAGMHAGTISIDSEPDVGTTVTVVIPKSAPPSA